MKCSKEAYFVLALGILLLLTGCKPTKVTYVGSAGYMLESRTKKILIDSPSADFVRQFEVPVASPITQDAIAAGEAPFDKVDLILITHSHPGHIDPVVLAGNMENNPKTRLVCNPTVYELLADSVTDFELIKDRITVVTLDADYQTTDIIVKGINIHVSRAPHWARPDTIDEGYLYNYAFNLGGVQIAYVLDEDNYVVTKDIDILFGSRFNSDLQPKYIVLGHQSGYANIASLAEQASVMPKVTFLTNSMQKAVLIKSHGGEVSEFDAGGFILNYRK